MGAAVGRCVGWDPDMATACTRCPVPMIRSRSRSADDSPVRAARVLDCRASAVSRAAASNDPDRAGAGDGGRVVGGDDGPPLMLGSTAEQPAAVIEIAPSSKSRRRWMITTR